MDMPSMCATDCACKHPLKFYRHSLSTRNIRFETLEDRKYMVVPVVMMSPDVVMNEAHIPADEMIAESWNGQPVVLQHPENDKGFVSANSPEVHESHRLGTIFNTRMEDNKFKADAWLDVKRMAKVSPGLAAMLREGRPIDVSVGYFCDEEEADGELGGRRFNQVHRDLKPDHLALLPGEIGACSWADGCGVRANTKRSASMALKNKAESAILGVVLKSMGLGEVSGRAIEVLSKLKADARGQDDDRRTLIHDLISNDQSPYTPDDEESLRMMTDRALAHNAAQFLAPVDEEEVEDEEEIDEESEEEESEEEVLKKKNKKKGKKFAKKKGKAAADEDETVEDEESEIEANADEDEKEEDEMKANSLTEKKVADMIAAGIAAGLKAHKAELPAEDVAALKVAKDIIARDRTEKVAKIVANSNITKEAAEAMDVATLDVVAAGLREVRDYSGLGQSATLVANAAEDDEAKAMSFPTTLSVIQGSKKGKAA